MTETPDIVNWPVKRTALYVDAESLGYARDALGWWWRAERTVNWCHGGPIWRKFPLGCTLYVVGMEYRTAWSRRREISAAAWRVASLWVLQRLRVPHPRTSKDIRFWQAHHRERLAKGGAP